MTSAQFAVTWDYRCPFARNFCEHVLVGLAAGAQWDVRFVPFALDQVHVAEGAPDVWGVPEKGPSLLALQAGVAVRDRFPEAFLEAHAALFAARHDLSLDLREPEVVRQVIADVGVDADAVLADVSSGAALETVRKEHDGAEADHAVFGVPTVIAGQRAAFVRVMHRPHGNGDDAVATVERVLQLVSGWPELNELKHTTIPR